MRMLLASGLDGYASDQPGGWIFTFGLDGPQGAATADLVVPVLEQPGRRSVESAGQRAAADRHRRGADRGGAAGGRATPV